MTTRLWVPIAPLILWALHFTAAYVVIGLVCGRLGSTTRLDVTTALWALTLVTLSSMAVVLVYGLRHYTPRPFDERGDGSSPEARRRFMAFATIWSSMFGACGTLAVTIALLWMPECQ